MTMRKRKTWFIMILDMDQACGDRGVEIVELPPHLPKNRLSVAERAFDEWYNGDQRSRDPYPSDQLVYEIAFKRNHNK